MVPPRVLPEIPPVVTRNRGKFHVRPPAAHPIRPDRALPPEDLRRQTEYFSDDFITKHLLDAIPSILLILNEHRQIVDGNRTLLELIGARSEDFIYCFRPGEILIWAN